MNAQEEFSAINIAPLTVQQRMESGKQLLDWANKWKDTLFAKDLCQGCITAPKPRTISQINSLMASCPPDWRRFCNGGPCACMGCVNGSFAGNLTQEEWESWIDRNPL